MVGFEVDSREESIRNSRHFASILNGSRDSEIHEPPQLTFPIQMAKHKGLQTQMKRFYSKIPFKLGKLNHIAIATRDSKSHLNFFGNILGANIGSRLVS